MYYSIGIKGFQGIHIEPNFDYTDEEAFFNASIFKNKEFTIYRGKRIFDIIEINCAGFYAISEKFKKILEDNNITGWISYPIKINGINEKYSIFQVIGKAGPVINGDKYGIAPIGNIQFDVDTIDGSDIFYLEDTYLKICNEKTKNIIEKSEISNIEFRPLVDSYATD